MRKWFYLISLLVILGIVGLYIFQPSLVVVIASIALPIVMLGIFDVLQTKKAVLRNFPIIGHFRYLLEMIRPEIQQYFIESDLDGKPFSRELRSVAYQRAKGALDTIPFGTKKDVYESGHEWINHSIRPVDPNHDIPRVMIGNEGCKQPYSASILNISAMSFGSLSKNAIMALNIGAKKGGFYHNTGEGGLSPYHLSGGGDLVWQLGTGYFGARNKDGQFDPVSFAERAKHPQVKMIEIKLSQGAKPGHGGILPAKKCTPEIAEIRGVPVGKTVVSPPYHSAFSTPFELIDFIAQLRELSGGKPVGFKLCLGRKSDFLAICKAMLERKVYPDFITVDGAEGGTGAAPLEFANSIGHPLSDGLTFVHSALVATRLRQHIKLIGSSKIITGFGIAKFMAMGADLCNSARGMMFAIGCIQALRCNNNDCPVGVATQDPSLAKGLDIADKAERAARFHKATVESFFDVIASAGLSLPNQVKPHHIQKRIGAGEVYHFGEIFNFLEEDAFETGNHVPEVWMKSWRKANPHSFTSF